MDWWRATILSNGQSARLCFRGHLLMENATG